MSDLTFPDRAPRPYHVGRYHGLERSDAALLRTRERIETDDEESGWRPFVTAGIAAAVCSAIVLAFAGIAVFLR